MKRCFYLFAFGLALICLLSSCADSGKSGGVSATLEVSSDGDNLKASDESGDNSEDNISDNISDEFFDISEEIVSDEFADGSKENVSDESADSSEEIVSYESADGSEENVSDESADSSEENVSDESADGSEEIVSYESADGSEASSDESADTEDSEAYVSTEPDDDVSEFEESSSEISMECIHVFGEWDVVISPSCNSKGEKKRECTICGIEETIYVEAVSHEEKFLDEKLPTCKESGLTSGKICALCNLVLEEQTLISPLGHKYSEEKTILPTCTEKGYTMFLCSCGDSYKDNYTPIIGHKYADTIVSPTCEKEGYTLHKCIYCSSSYEDTYTQGTHEYKSEVVAPTCEKEGYTLYKCTFCGDSYKESITEKTGHNYKETVILPTVEKSGYTKYACDKCKNVYTDNYTSYDSICENAYANNKTVLAMGIDVSKWNHEKDSQGNYLPLDWEAIKKAGVDFVILKAGSSKGADPVFEMNYIGAKEAGLDVGAYYYTYAMNTDDAEKDAQDFISLVKGKKFEYPLYMDFEDDSQKNISPKTKTKMIKSFVSTLQDAGYYSGLYTGYYWMTPRFNILEVEIVVDMLDLWYAHIDSAERVDVDTVYSWNKDDNLGHSEFGMWQYAHNGVFDFIDGEFFDFNYAYKDYPSIIKKLGLNGYSDYISETEYVWVRVRNLNVRSYWDTSVSSNILGMIHKGDKFEILEKTKEYVKINYNGTPAYISGDLEHISYTKVQ